jgi:acyl carrier protein
MTIEDKVRNFIVEELNWDGQASELTAEYPLIDGRVIDSLGIVQMVSFLEEEFGIRVGSEEVVPSNFESIRRLADFVNAKRGA